MTIVKTGRMNAMECRLGDIEEAFLELMIILVFFQNVSIAFFRCEHRDQ